MTSHTNCCVRDCKNTYLKRRSKDLQFYRFPSRDYEKERKATWINFVRRTNGSKDGSVWKPKKHSRICSEHFVGNRKGNRADSPSYSPSILPSLDLKKTLTKYSVGRYQRKELPHKCETCTRSFESEQSLSSHIVQMHNQLHRCTICDKTFSQSSLLQTHLFSYNGEQHFLEEPLKCDVCGKNFTRVYQLKNHRRTHDEKPYSCDQCLKMFSSLNGLHRHESFHVTEQNSSVEVKQSKNLSCEVCGMVFDRVNDAYVRHLYSHEERGMYRCYICNRKYSRKSSFDRHMRQHNAEKTHKCSRCHRSFLDTWILNDHMFRCKRDKIYWCKICLKSFHDDKLLTQHQYSHLQPGMVHTCKCETCKKRFSDTKELFEHQLTHTKEMPYQCDFCNKQFSKISALDRHLRFHTGLHECNMCDEAFNSVDEFRSHLETHWLSQLTVVEDSGVEQCQFLQVAEENPPFECDVKLLLSLLDHFH